MLDRLNDLRQLLAAIAALLAVYMYGVAYFALSDYYQAFGLTPADAGVTQSTLVALAFAGFGLLFGLLVVAVGAGWAVQRYVHNAPDERSFKRRRRTLGVMASAGWLSAALLARWVAPVALVVFAAYCGVFATTLNAEYREGATSRPIPSWAVPVGITVAVALGWMFFFQVATASEHLARKLMQDGDFRAASVWEATTRFALGVPAVPAEVDGSRCAVLIAFSGDHAWSMSSPGDTVEIRRIERTAAVARYATDEHDGPPRLRSCWTAP